jgi:nitrogen regulatory protein PII
MDKQNRALNPGTVQMLTLILSENQSHKCISLVKEHGIRGGMVIIGRGTVSSSVLNLLGIKNQRKDVVKFLLKKEKAAEILECLDQKLLLSKPGHGIAYTTPVESAVGFPTQETNDQEIATNTAQCMEGESMFKKLTVIVDRGMADDVMDIARKAGVRGGTILHGRGAGAEIATNLFGVEIEPEKELVIILMPNDLIDEVIHALSQELQLDEPGKGSMFVEPVLETRGLFETREQK